MTGLGGGGAGICVRLRKSIGGGGGATKTNKIVRNNNRPISEITQVPSDSSKTTEMPLAATDFYSQARKALSFSSPYDTEDSAATQVSASGANTLPAVLSQLLSKHSDGRRRQKKLHSKKSSNLGRLHGGNIWVESEEYFRGLTAEDIDRLDSVSLVGFSSTDKCFFIPSLGDDDTLCGFYAACNGILSDEKDSFNTANEADAVRDGKAEVEEMARQEHNEPHPMDADGYVGEINRLGIEDESQGEKRPSMKRKLSAKDAGMEKLFVVRPVQGLDSVCHYCSGGGDMGDQLNCLIKCASCGMMVHQRCYGVQEDVDSSWLCSWCKRKKDVGLNTERPCLLCPKQGGALKPVRTRVLGSEDERPEVKFAHLFCCQWMSDGYMEDTVTSEPIFKLDELEDRGNKSTCYLCKVKYGACVCCSHGACRTSFHPICAREARHRMEIWGRLGCDEVELCAFCSKHSDVRDDSGSQSARDVSFTENTLEIRPDSKFRTGSGDSLQPAEKEAGDENEKIEVNAHNAFSFMILKKLIHLGKVDAEDVASDIGVPASSLVKMLTDNHVVPEVESKLVKWLKSNAHIGSTNRNFKVKTGSLVAPKAEADLTEGPGAVSMEESDTCDASCVKSVPPQRRTKSRISIVKDDNPSFEYKLNHGKEDGVDISLQDQRLCGDGLIEETKKYQQMTTRSLVLTKGEVMASYVHPFIYSKLMQVHWAGFGERVVSHFGASSSRGLCCNNHDLQCRGGEHELSPSDEVEGELIYYQQRLICNAVARKRISDGLVSNVVKRLARETDAAGKQKWDDVVVNQYHHGLKEAKKHEMRARRQKEAQALLAAAAAAAVSASPRISSMQKDILVESANQEGTVCKGVDACIICYQKQGAFLKCSYGNCRSTFHPTCARNAGFYMTSRNNGGKSQHKAYCEKHSSKQRVKAGTQRLNGIKEFKSLKQVRVGLERLRLLCERILKREKLKRKLVLCSHDIFAAKKTSIISALASHPFYRPEVSSESAMTSLKAHTNSNISGSETVQISDDTAVNSTIAGKRLVNISMSMDNDPEKVDSWISQNLDAPKPMQRVLIAGKQIPRKLSLASRNLSDDEFDEGNHP